MADLFPATQGLLLQLLDGLEAGDQHLPEVRVGAGGRHGARYWLRGRQPRAFEERRPAALFEELRAGGYLRKLRSESSGVYYAFTPAAFQLRDKLSRPPTSSRTERRRASAPPPELLNAMSMLHQIHARADRVTTSLLALAEVSAIRTFRNDPSSGVFFVPMNPYSWLDLDREDIPLLGAARETGEAWLTTAGLIVAVATPQHSDAFEEHAEILRAVYIRGGTGSGPPAGSTAMVGAAVRKTIAEQLKVIDYLPGAVESSQLVAIPDTNALLQDSAIEDWVLGDAPVAITVPQQVISELDAKKVGANDKIAGKAEGLIRRFREYGRRGDTLVGVKLAGNVQFRELPVTPNMSLLPESFDPSNADDRILATAVHFAAKHLSSRVVLVTRDRNLQNKARLIGLPAVDVSDL
jgi:rRNA-processing protein FCF1